MKIENDITVGHRGLEDEDLETERRSRSGDDEDNRSK